MNEETRILLEETARFAHWLQERFRLILNISVHKDYPCCKLGEHPTEKINGLTEHIQGMNLTDSNGKTTIYLHEHPDILLNLAHEVLHIVNGDTRQQIPEETLEAELNDPNSYEYHLDREAEKLVEEYKNAQDKR